MAAKGTRMANRDLVAIGTSAGGVEALLQMARKLPPDFSAAVLVTIHMSAHHRLTRRCRFGDGASGLWALNQCGGISVVQDPKDAKFAEMPLNALTRLMPDHVAPLADIPALLHNLVRQPAGKPVAAPASLALEVDIARGANTRMLRAPQQSVGLTIPRKMRGQRANRRGADRHFGREHGSAWPQVGADLP